MIRFFLTLALALARILFRSRLELVIENLALRQQLAVFKHKRSRPRMGPGDRMFWVFLRQVWRNRANALIIIEPDTVVQWLWVAKSGSESGEALNPEQGDWAKANLVRPARCYLEIASTPTG